MYHSSVSPCQGSFPARRPFTLFTIASRKQRKPTPITYDPMLDAMLYASHRLSWR